MTHELSQGLFSFVLPLNSKCRPDPAFDSFHSILASHSIFSVSGIVFCELPPPPTPLVEHYLKQFFIAFLRVVPFDICTTCKVMEAASAKRRDPH